MEHAVDVKEENVMITFHSDSKLKRRSRQRRISLLRSLSPNLKAFRLPILDLKIRYLLKVHREKVRLDLKLKPIQRFTRFVSNPKIQLDLLVLTKHKGSFHLDSILSLLSFGVEIAEKLKRDSFGSR